MYKEQQNEDYLKGIDGRKIYIRHEHAALNSLLQGGGAIVMKKGLERYLKQDLRYGVPPI